MRLHQSPSSLDSRWPPYDQFRQATDADMKCICDNPAQLIPICTDTFHISLLKIGKHLLGIQIKNFELVAIHLPSTPGMQEHCPVCGSHPMPIAYSVLQAQAEKQVRQVSSEQA